MLVAAVVYLLLCLPLCVRAHLCLHGAQLEWHVSASVCGVGVGRDERVCIKDGRLQREGMSARRRRAGRSSERQRRAAGRAVRAVLRAAGRKSISVYAVIGMGDAAATALAAGAFGAAVNAAASRLLCPVRICVDADYETARLTAIADGIFVTTPGDIIAALLMNRAGRRTEIEERNEGMKWISTLLRA